MSQTNPVAVSEARSCAAQCSGAGLLSWARALVPILSWLPAYRWREDALSDLVAGLTVAIMHIPQVQTVLLVDLYSTCKIHFQGMAYGMLAGVEPVYGIYTGLWPVLVYVLLGNMPHVSMGTFAVISIMVKSVVDGEAGEGEDPSPSEIEVVTAVTFCVGLIQVVMGLLRLGSLTNLVSDAIISSFTVGASVHVATSQLKHVLGISVKSHSGAGRIVKIYIDLGRNIGDTNLVTLAISVACVAFIIVCSEVVQKKVKNYCSFPLPTQLVVMAIMTTVSYYLELSSEHGVRTIKDIGEIPLGLPSDPPYFPTSQFSLVPRVLGASLPIAVVSIVIGIGLGSMFADKHGYKVFSH